MALGVMDLGENRVEAAGEKIAAMRERPGPTPCWHMVGNIQRRKAGAAVECFDVVDALDRLALGNNELVVIIMSLDSLDPLAV